MDENQITVEARYVVYYNGYPLGNRYNMGVGKSGLSFPSILGAQFPHGFSSLEEAEEAARQMRAYVKDVKAKPRNKRGGSSKLWKDDAPPAKRKAPKKKPKNARSSN